MQSRHVGEHEAVRSPFVNFESTIGDELCRTLARDLERRRHILVTMDQQGRNAYTRQLGAEICFRNGAVAGESDGERDFEQNLHGPLL